MKTLKTIMALALLSAQVHAQSMGSIDDPVGGTAPSPRADRITWLKADIAEKNKLLGHELMSYGTVSANSTYRDAIKKDAAEIAQLQARR